MRDSCENIASKLKEIEDEQEIENKVYLEELVSSPQTEIPWWQDQLEAQTKIEEMYVKLHEIRQVTGARCLADGHSAAFLINSANREEMKNNKLAEMAEIEEDISEAEDDNARMDPPAESENKGKLNIYFRYRFWQAIFCSSTQEKTDQEREKQKSFIAWKEE